MDDFFSVKALFEHCKNTESRYQKIIELGRSLDQLPIKDRSNDNLVHGCQSNTYLDAFFCKDKVFFKAASDSLVSRGLAALLLMGYNGKSPEFILKVKPSFIDSIGITNSLSIGRSNGLASMYLHMQKLSLKLLTTIH